MSKPGETFYSSISTEASSQLKAREKLLATEYKTAEQLNYLNSNTGFIKVTSGVNSLIKEGVTGTPPEYTRNAPFTKSQDLETGDQGPFNQTTSPDETSSYLAQRVILFNGTAFDASGTVNIPGATRGSSTQKYLEMTGLRSGFNYDKSSSVVGSNKAYNNYNSLGIRPMPGVTGFDVQSYNTYGTLRVANVKFVVHTLEDLDVVEKLFLRPGYSCIVEWGHTLYIDNKGNTVKPVMGANTLSSKTLFAKNKTVKDVEKDIESKRKKSNFNYDAFFGYVTNFDYSFRPDGGFDCSIKIASKGQVLDSLKSGGSADAASTKPNNDEEKEDKEAEYLTSVYHFWFSAIKSFYNDAISNKEFVKKGKDGIDKVLGVFQEKFDITCDLVDDLDELKNNFHAIYTPVTENDSGFFGFFQKSREKIYIPLRFFLSIFNTCGSLYSGKFEGKKQRFLEFSTGKSNKYNSFGKLFSTKIDTVLIATNATYDGIKYFFHGNDDNVFDVNQAMIDYSKSNDGLYNDILDIHLSLGLIEKKLEPFIKDTGNDINLVDFIKSLLSHINSALGNITDLDIYYNEGINEYEIVDRYGPKKSNITKLNLAGLKSTVKDLSINSTISNEIASSIAIAAQGRSSAYPANVKSIRGWNEGYRDRFFLEKLTKEDQKQVESQALTVESYFEKNQDINKAVDEYWKHLNEKGEINAGTQASIETELNKILNIAYEQYLVSNGKPSTIPIPVQLSFTIKGFSGFKIGQSFKVQDSLLLPKYKKYCYIITSLEHKVEANEWVTSLGAQFFEVD